MNQETKAAFAIDLAAAWLDNGQPELARNVLNKLITDAINDGLISQD
jgi:hypothetical protein